MEWPIIHRKAYLLWMVGYYSWMVVSMSGMQHHIAAGFLNTYESTTPTLSTLNTESDKKTRARRKRRYARFGRFRAEVIGYKDG